MSDAFETPKILDDGLPATGTVRIQQLYAVGGPFHGVSRSTVWKWIAEGRLATLKLSQRVTVVQVTSARALLEAAGDTTQRTNARDLPNGNALLANNTVRGSHSDPS